MPRVNVMQEGQAPSSIANLDNLKLTKDRRDWLCIFGNQWGRRGSEASERVLDAEEKQALTEALNPWK